MATQEPEKPAIASVTDRRPQPTGVLPKHLQTWIMAGIALVIILIILLTGHSEPPMTSRATGVTREATLPQPERIRGFQQQLVQEEARLRAAAGERASEVAPVTPSTVGGQRGGASGGVAESRVARRSDLFADNVVLSRRPTGQQSYAATTAMPEPPSVAAPAANTLSDLAELRQALTAQAPTANSAALPTAAADTRDAVATASSAAPVVATTTGVSLSPAGSAPTMRYPIVEGTTIESVLINRLDGSFAGPVSCQVTAPVYSRGRDVLLIPAGARLLGEASPVQAWGDSRLAVGFHRLLMPDGRSYSLDGFKGLDQAGESGLRDSVDRHYLQVFGASIAIGALSGLTQFNTRGGVGDFGDQYRQAMGSSLGTSASHVLDRYLNVLPTITVREGHRVHVYLTKDLELPAYNSNVGGAR